MADKMKNCSTCNAEIASSAKTCPNCGAKNKKPIYKRWWFILIVVLSAFGSLGGGDTETPEAQDVATEQPAEEPVNVEPAMTMGQHMELALLDIRQF